MNDSQPESGAEAAMTGAGARQLRVVPSGPDRTQLPVIALDPGFLPTTRQMALALADHLTDYYTPYASSGESHLLTLPRIGAELARRKLPAELAGKARLVETGTELLRLSLIRAHVRNFDYQLMWRRNAALDAHVPAAVPAGATVIAQYGGCKQTFKRARVLYGRTVLDHPVARWQYGRELLDEEVRRRPEFADTIDQRGGRLDRRHLERIDAEVELSDMIVVGSKFAAASFAGVVPADRIKVIPYGVDLAAFAPRSRVTRPGSLKVLFAGQVTQRKGMGYLLDAMRLLDPKRFELEIVGRVRGSGAGLRTYEGLFRHTSAVRPAEMPWVYQRADVLVLPSIVEGSALVVLEAMASGVPVVVTPNAGADAVRDGVDGFVVPLRSPEAIAERLSTLEADPALRARMGAAARERAQEFGWEAFRSAFRRTLGFPDVAEQAEEPRRELSA
jgi:glycosyltransferase involved in cell wall biosynthesis